MIFIATGTGILLLLLATLSWAIAQRRRMEQALHRAHRELDRRVQERTAEPPPAALADTASGAATLLEASP